MTTPWNPQHKTPLVTVWIGTADWHSGSSPSAFQLWPFACGSRALPKEKIERLIVDQLRRGILTKENLNELIELAEAGLKAEAKGKVERMRRVE